MTTRARITVITLTLNEERNIRECLETVRWADEIIVVDSGSADRTVEIAKEFTPHVHVISWPGYGPAKNYALERASGEWILWLDADERVTPELAREIGSLLDRPEVGESGFAMARRAYFLGRWIRHAGWYPSRVVRLFRRGRLELEGRVGVTQHDLLHFTDPDLHHYLMKFNRYTTLAAEEMERNGRRSRVPDLLLRPLFQFVKMYLFRRGFLDGIEGFILSILSSAYVFVKYAKLWERRRRTPAEGT
jgi:glycosyltransferase involved in cell wall biosynthesis